MSYYIFLLLLSNLLSFSFYLFKFRIYERRIEPILKWAKSEGYRIPRKPNIFSCYLYEGKYHWHYFPLNLFLLSSKDRKKTLDYFYQIEELKKKRESKKNKSTEKVPKSATEYFNRAVSRISKYDTRGAISDLSKCIELDSIEAKYYRFRGLAKKELGNLKRGCEDWLLASKLGDKESDSLIKKHSKTVGEIYRDRGLAKKEVNDLKGAIKEWELAENYGDDYSKELLSKYKVSNFDEEKKVSNQKINSVDEKRRIDLYGEITDQVANSIVSKLLEMDSKDTNKPIEFFIKSLGGSVTSGLAIYDTMKYVKSEVHTICTGRTSGMGTFLLCAGSKGFRFSYPKVKISLSELSSKNKIPDNLVKKEMERLKDMIYFTVSENTGQSVERIKDDSNYWSKNGNYELSPEEAINYGIIDKICHIN